MRKLKKFLSVLILSLQVIKIIWTYYDEHAEQIKQLIADAQASIQAMKQARASLARDAGRDLAVRAFARLKENLKDTE